MINKNKKSNVFAYVFLFLGIFLIYLISRLISVNENVTRIQQGMMVLIVALITNIVIKYRKKTLTESQIIKALIWLGIIMRVGYMLYTGCDTRGHDMHKFVTDGGGQAGYLLTIIQEGKLPQSNFLQYYQQPFFYVSGALVSKVANGILGSSDPYYLVDAAKIISCFASCSCILLTDRLSAVAGLKKCGRAVAVAIVAFTPAFYLAGGRTNCDALTVFFMLMEILFTMYLYREPSWKNFISLAFIYGCGVMTKISCGSIALFTVIVFIKMIYEHRTSKGFLELIKKYAVFGLISLPTGLWYGIRNYIRFGQKLTYVLRLSKDSNIYCGDYSIIQRFLSVDLKNIFSTPYTDPYSNYNLPVYLIKSSVFGEFTFEINKVIPVILIFTSLILTGLMIYATGKAVISYKKDIAIAEFGVIFWLMIIMTVFFCITYPFGCSMDYRYVIILSVVGAVSLGKLTDEKKLRGLTIAVTSIYSLFSILMYLFIK